MIISDWRTDDNFKEMQSVKRAGSKPIGFSCWPGIRDEKLEVSSPPGFHCCSCALTCLAILQYHDSKDSRTAIGTRKNQLKNACAWPPQNPHHNLEMFLKEWPFVFVDRIKRANSPSLKNALWFSKGSSKLLRTIKKQGCGPVYKGFFGKQRCDLQGLFNKHGCYPQIFLDEQGCGLRRFFDIYRDFWTNRRVIYKGPYNWTNRGVVYKDFWTNRGVVHKGFATNKAEIYKDMCGIPAKTCLFKA